MKKITSLLMVVALAFAFIAAPITTHAKNEHKEYDKKEYRDYSKGWRAFFSNLKNRLSIRVEADTKAKVSISRITAPTVLTIGQEGTWVVNASDSKNGSLLYAVEWGDEKTSSSSRMATNAFVQTSTFTHVYDKAGTYTVKFKVQNESGSKATSSVTVRVNDDAEDDDPVISNVSASAITAHGAKITWNTNVRANSSIWYGTNSPLDTSGDAMVAHSGNMRMHTVVLKDLIPDTKYYVVVGSENRNGMTKSSEISFTTLQAPSTAPVIDRISTDTEIVVGETVALVVDAHDPRNRSLSYSVNWGDSAAAITSRFANVFTQTATFDHVYETKGTYDVTVTVQNDMGESVTKSIKITVS